MTRGVKNQNIPPDPQYSPQYQHPPAYHPAPETKSFLPSWNMNQIMTGLITLIGLISSIVTVYISLTNQMVEMKLGLDQAKQERNEIKQKLETLNTRGTESASAKFSALDLKISELVAYNNEDTKEKEGIHTKIKEISDSGSKMAKEAISKLEFDIAKLNEKIEKQNQKAEDIANSVEDLYTRSSKSKN